MNILAQIYSALAFLNTNKTLVERLNKGLLVGKSVVRLLCWNIIGEIHNLYQSVIEMFQLFLHGSLGGSAFVRYQ